MNVEIWINTYGDKALFIGYEYVIFKKIDDIKPELICSRGLKYCVPMDKIKLAYYKNGFRPIDDNVKSICGICKFFNTCCKGENTTPCCSCNRVRMCPDQKMLEDKLVLKTVDKYEEMIKQGDNT
ncbi:MAG: hypothetical protein J6A59_01630 [Lachnospiraceae bacterium]|nr:hypothetical protein [Lachnospiraceae bacterium]